MNLFLNLYLKCNESMFFFLWTSCHHYVKSEVVYLRLLSINLCSLTNGLKGCYSTVFSNANVCLQQLFGVCECKEQHWLVSSGPTLF